MSEKIAEESFESEKNNATFRCSLVLVSFRIACKEQLFASSLGAFYRDSGSKYLAMKVLKNRKAYLMLTINRDCTSCNFCLLLVTEVVNKIWNTYISRTS